MRAKELFESNRAVMYHVTETDRVDRILRSGLIPQRRGIRGVADYGEPSIFLLDNKENDSLAAADSVVRFGGQDLEDPVRAEMSTTLLRIDMRVVARFDAKRNLNRTWRKDPNAGDDGAYITNKAIPAEAISVERVLGDDIYEEVEWTLQEQTVNEDSEQESKGRVFGFVTDTHSNHLETYFVRERGVPQSSIDLIREQFKIVAVLETIHVEEAFRSQGHGTSLMEQFMSDAIEKGAEAVLTVVDPKESTEINLIEWYKSWYFEPWDYTSSGVFMVTR